MSGRLGAVRRRPLKGHGRNARFADGGVRGERGYALLVILIALAIVGWLARDSIKQMFATVTGGAGKSESRMQAAPPPVDATQATPAAAMPVERARSVEDTVLQRAQQSGSRIDAAQ